jgi:hypothetical protein
MAKKYDLAVKVGSYTDGAGNQKNRYKNIGALMTGNDGGEYILLEKTFFGWFLVYVWQHLFCN